ncbi:hypothetical protein DPMN_096778 [Dreissena polymorpha]|uniref:Ig-like domain-containing protein n=1 Tax=Dreissena polymorpha TaxID=45954 RepID=A0A9D4LAI4_DREPO|nr:hypothetical protein DPMN_096778 [Dreissena polymorpha]
MPLIRTSKWPLRVIGCKLVLFMICEISHGQSIKGPSYVTENSNHTFSCDYSTCSVSAITCTYSWNSSLITLPTDTSSKHITLTSIRREWNNAIINCNINVNGSSHVTAATRLNVQYGPLAANIPVKSPYTVTEGNTTSIACQAPACNPTCTAKWFNGSTQILSTTLFGEPVRRHFAGFYTCHVSNSVGNRTSQLHLIVNYVPILLGHNRTYNVSKGYPLTVTIPVSACPAVLWKDIKIGDRFVNDNIIVNLTNGIDVQQCIASAIQTLSVVINATQEEHFRNFTVNFTNAVDTTTTHFAIFPQGPPDVPLRFDEKSTTYHSVTFVVESGFFNGGEQTFVLQYRRVNSDSLWENGSIAYVGKEKNVEVAMTVDDLSPVTDYEFRVYAFNEYAQSKYSTVVQITTALHVGMVVGSVIGGVAGIVLIVLVVYFVCLKQKHDKKPPPIVPFTNILGALEEEKRQGHPQSNMYMQSSTESENVYMNTNTTKVTPLTVDDEEQYVNQVGVAPDRLLYLNFSYCLTIKNSRPK